MPKAKLIYLGCAFPPGVAALFPTIQPASQYTEPNFIHSIKSRFDIRTVGCWSLDVEKLSPDPAASPGLNNALNLMEGPPRLRNRLNSLRRLKRTWRQWREEGWEADIVLVFSSNPVYNAFVRWLRHRPDAPRLVLLLGDCPTLGEKISAWRRFRYSLMPMRWFEHQMLPVYDACVSASREADAYFVPRGVPWLWLPPAIDEERVVNPLSWPEESAAVFGFAGSLGDHSGLLKMLGLYRELELENLVRVAGYGKNCERVAALASEDRRIEFAGTLKPGEPLHFAQRCDVMLNPRPLAFGNRYTFPSKLLEYALVGRAILSVRMAGIDELLGPEAFYFEPEDYDQSLKRALCEVAKIPRSELQRRGMAIRNRLLNHHSWQEHGQKLAGFLDNLL